MENDMDKPTKPARRRAAKTDPIAAMAATTPPAMADDAHPAYVGALVADELEAFTPDPGGPLPGPFPGPLPGPLPDPFPLPVEPGRLPVPGPFPLPPLRFCGPVSGRYRRRIAQVRPGLPVLPRLFVTVRVDVDRFYPQRRISVEVQRLLPTRRAHVIAEVTSDRCSGLFRRRIEANVTYRDGDDTLIPAVRLVFEARRTAAPFAYGAYRLTLIDAGGQQREHDLDFVDAAFDDVEFEVDQVENATPVVTSYDTGSHPNRPGSVPAEVVDFATTYRRAGFNVTMSPNVSSIPLTGAGANSVWSDAEMHDAMVTFWSRFQDRPQWAMWVLFAAQHDRGRSLGGIMFDDIGPNHRQGTAIFTDSFIVDVTPGDPAPDAWRRRMVYWTAVHEMGHAFNLAHAWQKSLGRPDVEGDPWIPLMDDAEARSFMNYPFLVNGGEQAFFEDFEFRFTDDELVFMRHAPRRFVQMGNENWFENHGFEKAFRDPRQRFALEVRPNRDANTFSFLEPVKLELKLTNLSATAQSVDEDAIEDGRHVAMLVKREGNRTCRWKPFATYCHAPHTRTVKPGESLYASHFVAATAEGWLIDEPGFYLVQAAVKVGDEMVISDPLRIFVAPPQHEEESRLAPDYFREDVARVLAFNGAPSLEKANDVLREVAARCKSNPAALHAAVAVNDPGKRAFKTLEAGRGRADLAIRAVSPKMEETVKQEVTALTAKPDEAARTLGHIDYRNTSEKLADALAEAGRDKEAVKVQTVLVETLEKRGVLKSVVAASQRKLEKIGG
jgi:hypothetical protein